MKIKSVVQVSLVILMMFASNAAFAQFPFPPITFEPATPTMLESEPSLIVTSPLEGEVVTLIRNCDTCPAFIEFDAIVGDFDLGEITEGQYPCSPVEFCDTCIWRGGGQHIFVVIDKGSGRTITDVNTTNYIQVEDTTPGPHTLIAFMSYSWDEAVKDIGSVSALRETNLYTVRTFYIDTNTGTHAMDSTTLLLTPSSPLDTNNYVYPTDSVMLDFYTMFEQLSDGYVVEAMIYDSTMQVIGGDTLTQWIPYCIQGLAQPPEGRLGKYFIRVRLLDNTSFSPVTNGTGNLNQRLWPFWIRRTSLII